MKNALSRTLVDPVLAEAEVVPPSTMEVPPTEPVIPIQDLLNDALSHRAELAQSRIDLTNRDITNRSARNALLPSLGLFAYYGGSAGGGGIKPNIPPSRPPSNRFWLDPHTITPPFQSPH